MNEVRSEGMFGRVTTLLGALGSVSLLAGLANDAGALEYCVTCEGPPALYRCVIEGTPDGPGKDPTASLFCISEMATKGRHERCGVSRGAPFPCPGLTATVAHRSTAPALPAPAAAPEHDAPPAGGEAAAPPPAETRPEAEKPAPVPRTVEELAGQTVKSSKESLEKAGEAIGGTAKKAGEQIGNAGNAIGDAAKSTWNCLTSLFSSCGPGQETEAAPEHQGQPAGEPSTN